MDNLIHFLNPMSSFEVKSYLNNVNKPLGDGELVEWISQHSVDPRRAELGL